MHWPGSPSGMWQTHNPPQWPPAPTPEHQAAFYAAQQAQMNWQMAMGGCAVNPAGTSSGGGAPAAAARVEKRQQSRSRSRSDRKLARHSSGEKPGGDGGRIILDDENKKLSNQYNQLGQQWNEQVSCTPICVGVVQHQL